MKGKECYVYLHCKPDGTPFYVGKGQKARASSLHPKLRNVWHGRIVEKYGKENIDILMFKKDSEESAFKSEIRMIKMLRNAGFELCNMTDGGDGSTNPPQEVRDKISARLKGNSHTLGHVLSDEHKLKLSISQTGKKFSIESLKKRSIIQKGMKRSDETKARISKSKTGKKINRIKPHSLETRLKMSIAAKARLPFSDAHRAALSLRSKQQWFKRKETALNRIINQNQ